MDLQKNYDRVLLVVGSVLAIAGGGWWASRAMSFDSNFEREPVTEGKKLTSLPADTVNAAIDTLAKGVTPWVAPAVGHKVTPLFASTPFVIKKDSQDTPIDMLAEGAEQLRAPIENWWLVKNNLDYTLEGTGEEDTDGDEFSNLDEFNAKTDPRSQLSRPTPITKLYYRGRGAIPLTLRLNSFDASSGTANVRTIGVDESTNAESAKTEFKKIGERFRGNRFVIKSHKQEAVEKAGSVVMADVITIEDTVDPTGNPIRLEQGKPVERPSYFANLHYGLTGKDFKPKKGDDIDLERPPITVQITAMDADSVTIEFTPEGQSAPETKRLEKTSN